VDGPVEYISALHIGQGLDGPRSASRFPQDTSPLQRTLGNPFCERGFVRGKVRRRFRTTQSWAELHRMILDRIQAPEELRSTARSGSLEDARQGAWGRAIRGEEMGAKAPSAHFG